MKVAIKGNDIVSQYCALEFKKNGHQVLEHAMDFSADLVIYGTTDLSSLNYLDSLIEYIEPLRHTETKLILLSSSDVYGINQLDNGEDSGPWSTPTSIFAASRYWAEDACRILLHKDQFRIARLASVYGPGAAWPFSNQLHNILWCAANRKEVTVGLHHARSWMNVKDAARAIVQMSSNWDFPNGSPTGPWQTYNVCDSDNLRPATEMAEIAYAISGAPLSLIKHFEGKEEIVNPSNARLKALYSAGEETIKIRTVSGLLETLSYVARWDSNGEYTGS